MSFLMILDYFLNTLVSNPKPGVGFLSSFDSLERLHGSVFTCVSKVLDVFLLGMETPEARITKHRAETRAGPDHAEEMATTVLPLNA